MKRQIWLRTDCSELSRVNYAWRSPTCATASCVMRCVQIVQSLTKSLSTAKNWMWHKQLFWVLVAPQSGWKSIASQTSLSRGGGVEAKIWEKPTCQDGRAKIWSFGPSKPYTEERPPDKRRRHNMAVTVSANHPWRHNEEFCILKWLFRACI